MRPPHRRTPDRAYLNADSTGPYGTWPEGLLRMAAATADGIGAQVAGMSAAKTGFKV